MRGRVQKVAGDDFKGICDLGLHFDMRQILIQLVPGKANFNFYRARLASISAETERKYQ